LSALIPDGAARAGTAIGLAVALVSGAGCRTAAPLEPKAAAPSRPAPSASEIVDERAEAFLVAFRNGDDAAATRDFAPRLAREVTPARLGEVRQSMVGAHGKIVDWTRTRTAVEDHLERREYRLRFERGAMAAHLSFDPDAHRMLGLFFTRTFEPAPTPGTEAFLSTLDVTVGPGLGATITLPRGAGAGPFPAVVLVPGSGPNDRDETIGNVRPFRDLAEGLAASRIVSIRFDKRPFARPEQFMRGLITVDEELVQDALAAVAVVKQQPLVDGKRVFVVGHSLGALLAPEIATRAGGVDGVVMIAAPGRPLMEVLLDQVKRTGVKDAVDRVEKSRQAIDDPGSNPIQFVEGMPIAYWRDLAARNAFDFARRFPGPILLLRGADDTNVLAVDQQAWVQNLAGRGDVTERTIPGLTHTLAPALELALAAARVTSGRGARVSDKVIDEIAHFVTAGARRP